MADVLVRVRPVSGPQPGDWAVLQPTERERAERRREPGPFVTAHATLRRLVGEHLGVAPEQPDFARRCETCGADRHGKPVVTGHPGVHISLSYGDRLVLVGLTTAGPLGVDVEDRASADFDGFDSVTLAESERAAFASLPAARLLAARARVWARKEAVLKATGHGLAIDPSRIAVTGPGQAPALARWEAEQPPPRDVWLEDVDVADGVHEAAVAVLSPGPHHVVRT